MVKMFSIRIMPDAYDVIIGTLLSQRTIGIALPGTFATIWSGVIWEKRQDPSSLFSGIFWLKTGVVTVCFGFSSCELVT